MHELIVIFFLLLLSLFLICLYIQRTIEGIFERLDRIANLLVHLLVREQEGDKRTEQ